MALDSGVLSRNEGFYWRNPWMAGLLTVNLLSLVGIPLTLGFIGKLYAFTSSAQAACWPLVIAVVIGSGIGLYYYLTLRGPEKNRAIPAISTLSPWERFPTATGSSLFPLCC